MFETLLAPFSIFKIMTNDLSLILRVSFLEEERSYRSFYLKKKLYLTLVYKLTFSLTNSH